MAKINAMTDLMQVHYQMKLLSHKLNLWIAIKMMKMENVYSVFRNIPSLTCFIDASSSIANLHNKL
jgi:hypothetical protein